MRHFYVSCVVLLLAFVVTTNASSPFYYGSNGTIPLKIDSSKVQLKFNEGITTHDIEIAMSSHFV